MLFRSHSFTCRYPVFPAPFIEEAIFAPLYILASFVKNKISMGAWVYFWGFYIVPLIYVSVFVPVSHCLDDVFVVNLKSGRLIPPAPFFFLKTPLAILGLLCFHMNCEIFCSSSVKNVVGNLIEIALNLWIAFGSIVIFTVLILPTQEHGISLHLFMSSDFFHQCLIIFCMQFFFLLQFSSVAQLCPALCDPMNRSTLGLPVHHQLSKFTQTHVH